METIQIRPPSLTCAICNKTLDEIGGKRVVSQKLRGIALSETYKDGGNKDFPYQLFKLSEDPDLYMVVWGEKDKWTESAIERAKAEFLNGNRPWFCQVCGEKKCSKCGAPINVPMGSDILHDDGSISHVAIFGIDPGCINTECDKYREWG